MPSGTRLGRYEIRSLLGVGGMGEVYLAQDRELDRKVAIKFLPESLVADEQARKRLVREAQAAAKLDHPNICAIHEVGEEDGRSFIVMQYVEGETLDIRIKRRPPDLLESLSISSQIADALAEAHARGIIHRDIKPSNIIITSRGQAKVMDFGLAKTVPSFEAVASEAPTESFLSTPGTIIGTVPYMSPEQVKGEHVDARTDIFSFGVVLYEMLSGRQPFTSESKAATASAILTHEPPPLARYSASVPEELQRIVRKCLAKNRELRYQSARDLVIDLRNLERAGSEKIIVAEQTAPHTRRSQRQLYVAACALTALALIGLGVYVWASRGQSINSIAVLPFANATDDPNTEYLSDGISESLIDRLSQLPQLKVIARSSAFKFKGKEIDPPEVARSLGVQALVLGRVMQRGDQLQVRAELVDARDKTQMWGEQYSRKAADLQAIQEEVARTIAEKLRLRLTGAQEQRLAKRATENAEAYQLYLNGEFYIRKNGIEYFRKALTITIRPLRSMRILRPPISEGLRPTRSLLVIVCSTRKRRMQKQRRRHRRRWSWMKL
jgi:serine/threonine protein kinase